MDVKSFFASKTCMAALCTMLASVVMALLPLFGVKANESQVMPFIQIGIAVVGGIIVWYGRATATGPLNFFGLLLQPMNMLDAALTIKQTAGTILTVEQVPSLQDCSATSQPAPAPAATAPSAVPGFDKPGGFIRTGPLVGIVLVLAVAGLLIATFSGCALKKITQLTGPEQARVAAQELMLSYEDVYGQYQALEPQLTPEQRAQARASVTPAINRAKPVVIALASAANVWSITADHNATGGQEVAAIATEAHTLFDQALALFNQIRR